MGRRTISLSQLPPSARVQASLARERSNRDLFIELCGASSLPIPIVEYKVLNPATGRSWRFDFAWIFRRYPVALEVDGGLYVAGGHVRGAMVERTHIKLNHVTARGWRVLHTVPSKLCTPETIELVRKTLDLTG